MGKRELLLVLGFVLLGTIIYHATAPPPSPGQRSFSIAAVIDHLRRGIRGNRASAQVTSTPSFPLQAGTTELRIAVRSAESLTITGEDRADITGELRVWSNGLDEAEAQQLAKATVLKTSEGGGRVTIEIAYPDPGSQRANLSLRVPARLRVNVARYSGKLNVSNTAQVELVDTRGEAFVRQVDGPVTASHRSGELNVADARRVRLNVRGTDVRLTRIGGELTVQAQSGEIVASELSGAVDVESNGTDLTLEKLEKATGPVRVNATNGSVKLTGIRSDTRVDARNTEVVIAMAQAAQLAVYNEGDEPIDITTPRAGYTLDALATNGGRIILPEGTLDVTTEGTDQRAAGAVRGGGPTLTLRANRGEIVVRAPQNPAAAGAPTAERSPLLPVEPGRKPTQDPF